MVTPLPIGWYAAYTKPRTEKKVFERLARQGVEVYLPLQRTLKQWSDRKKWVEEPLIRSYVFVRESNANHSMILSTEGLVRYIGFGGRPAVVPHADIVKIQQLLGQAELTVEASAEPIAIGSQIVITTGSLQGLSGEVVEHRGRQKLVVRLEAINYSILVSLPQAYLELDHKHRSPQK